MVIIRTRNKITDFLMILAWASPFNEVVAYRSFAKHYWNMERYAIHIMIFLNNEITLIFDFLCHQLREARHIKN